MEPEHAEIEERLTRLVPARPRAGFRAELLGKVHAELASDTRGLARPWPWAAAAAALLVLCLAGAWSRSASGARLRAAAMPPASSAAAEIAALLPEGAARRALVRRLRLLEARAIERDPARRRWVEHVLSMRQGEVNHG
jgi:hypothetical protein